MKATDRRKQYIKKWRQNHRVQARASSYRTTSRTFIRHYASVKDLNNLMDMIKAKKHSLLQS